MITFETVRDIPAGFTGPCYVKPYVYCFFKGFDPGLGLVVHTGFIQDNRNANRRFWYCNFDSSNEEEVMSQPCFFKYKLTNILNYENV